MLSWLDAFFTRWLGTPGSVGAASWLQALTWIAAVLAAIIAGLSLRRNSLQTRAALLLNLYKSWEDLADQRKEFSAFFHATRNSVIKSHANLQEHYQTQQMRQEFQQKLVALRDSNDPKFTQFTAYLSFFEVLGMYVKNGYVPIRDISQVYKGPILAVDIAWRDFIKAWEKEAHVPQGLLEHAIFLMDAVRTKSDHPVYYWAVYRFRRFF